MLIGWAKFEELRRFGPRPPIAEFLRIDKFGTVSVGKTVDLVLVEGDSLKEVTNASRRAGVMTRGRLFSEQELRKLLDGMATSYGQR